MDQRLVADLDRMRTAAINAIEFIGADEDTFVGDAKTQAAVAMCLVIIGEAAARVQATSPDFVASHPEWPWTEMRGMRNRAAHDYDTINFRSVWQTVKVSIPTLVALIDRSGVLGGTTSS